MGVMFTAEAEKRRQEAFKKNAKTPVRKKAKWELFKTESIVRAVHFAREHGWKDNKVQVKGYQITNDGVYEYVVEPFEEDCNCPSLLRYEDYNYGDDPNTLEDNEE